MRCFLQGEFLTQKEAAWAISNFTVSGNPQQVWTFLYYIRLCLYLVFQYDFRWGIMWTHLFSSTHTRIRAQCWFWGTRSWTGALNGTWVYLDYQCLNATLFCTSAPAPRLNAALVVFVKFYFCEIIVSRKQANDNN